MTDFCSYAMTPFSTHAMQIFCSRLEHDVSLAIEWFECNYMKLNKGRCQLLLAGNKHETVWVNVGCSKI